MRGRLEQDRRQLVIRLRAIPYTGCSRSLVAVLPAMDKSLKCPCGIMLLDLLFRLLGPKAEGI